MINQMFMNSKHHQLVHVTAFCLIKDLPDLLIRSISNKRQPGRLTCQTGPLQLQTITG